MTLPIRLLSLRLTLLELSSLLLSFYFVYIYLQTKYWLANNAIAIAFSIYTIENWLVGNMRKIYVIFTGLLLYDVYFVFQSDVMMTVAQQMELPLKLLFPVDSSKFAMIGLGDIIIPGLFSSMCIRRDLLNAFISGKERAVKEGIKDRTTLSRIVYAEMGCFYFYNTIAGYFIGLTLTYAAMERL